MSGIDYVQLGKSVGELVAIKQEQYGDAFGQAGRVLRVLYPHGVRPEQYDDLLALVRVIDKLFRVANGDRGDESAWRDIAGYGLLGVARKLEEMR